MYKILLALREKQTYSLSELEETVDYLISQHASESEIAAFLMGMDPARVNGETLYTIAKSIRAVSSHLHTGIEGAMDNCGTGGDGSNSFNISTASAFVLAGGGVTMAKHGNRNVSSKSGSMDVLDVLKIKTMKDKVETIQSLKEHQLAFFHAAYVHPRLKKVMQVRRELRIPTVFNLIGPMTNPVELTYQLVGVAKPYMLTIYVKALQLAGRKRAGVLHGAGGMDEASLQGENKLFLIENGRSREIIIHPADVGLKTAPNKSLKGGTPAENGAIMLKLLQGENSVYFDAVCLNAGIGFYIAEKAESIREGVSIAKAVISSGKALQKYNEVSVRGNASCQTT